MYCYNYLFVILESFKYFCVVYKFYCYFDWIDNYLGDKCIIEILRGFLDQLIKKEDFMYVKIKMELS